MHHHCGAINPDGPFGGDHRRRRPPPQPLSSQELNSILTGSRQLFIISEENAVAQFVEEAPEQYLIFTITQPSSGHFG